MSTNPFTHFVFVDFENVPDFSLELIAGHPIRVTVLVGKNQTKHLTKLKEQLRKLKLKGAVIEVGAAGRNALDIALAYYLGQAVQHNPSAQFCILAKDRGYESLIQHLHAKEVKVARYGETYLLPFVKKPKKPASTSNVT